MVYIPFWRAPWDVKQLGAHHPKGTTIFPMKVEKERKVHQKTNWKPDRLSEILLMAQIRRSPVDMVKYPTIYRVLAPSQVVGKGLSAINSMVSKKKWALNSSCKKQKISISSRNMLKAPNFARYPYLIDRILAAEFEP